MLDKIHRWPVSVRVRAHQESDGWCMEVFNWRGRVLGWIYFRARTLMYEAHSAIKPEIERFNQEFDAALWLLLCERNKGHLLYHAEHAHMVETIALQTVERDPLSICDCALGEVNAQAMLKVHLRYLRARRIRALGRIKEVLSRIGRQVRIRGDFSDELA